jgi:peptidoglycan/xylan/chitin deacetylase (PgdA/CDA1 family)
VVPGSTYAPSPTIVARPPGAKPLMLHVPILEYHRIVPAAQAGNSVAALTTDPQLFDEQMAALSQAGWHAITLAALADDLTANLTPPSHTFVVTIDDGWSDSYQYASTILGKYGYVATYFVIAARIGQPQFMTPEEIRILASLGNDIGDHTADHISLTAVQPKTLTYEVDAGAATIAAITGRWPETFAYPRGKADSRVLAAVAACASLKLAVVEGAGARETWDGRFHISRIEVGSWRLPAVLLGQVERAGR